jgi:putative DNA primase/helicase
MNEYLHAAQQWLAAGCNVIPVRTDSDNPKAPALASWKEYITRLSTTDELQTWFGSGHSGMGIVCGAISGNLEMLEFEGRAVNLIESFTVRLNGQSTGLVQRLWSYVEQSPSGGIHFFYRVSGVVDGNSKLARDAEGLTLIETRGEGGQVVVAPSAFQVYSPGDAWHVLNGSVNSIPVISEIELEIIHEVARSFDEMPPPIPIPDTFKDNSLPDGEVTPGEDFNIRGSWHDMLVDNGWKVFKQGEGDSIVWTRPGKRYGTSAITGGTYGDYFWGWSTEGMIPELEAMSKWRVYAHLYHGGDFSAAASALRKDGYGSPLKQATVQGTFTPLVMGTDSIPAALTPTTGEVYLNSDTGMAQVLVNEFGPVIRYSPERGRWMVWASTHWRMASESSGGSVRELVKKIASDLEGFTPAQVKWKGYALSAQGTTNILRQAQTDARVVVSTNDLDNRPYELNTPAGIVDLRTMAILPHDPAAMHTQITLASPDFNADMTKWLGFLDETFKGKEDLVPYIQKLVGYSASGVIADHVLPFCYGSGGNGKGVFLETIQKIMGDYGTTTPNGFLMASMFKPHATELASLSGKRIVLCSEVNKGDRFDEAKVKKLTGGDTIKANFMRQDEFTFEPTHKLWLMGNEKPTVETGGHSFFRRAKLLEFTNEVPDDKMDVYLGQSLVEEHASSVMAWIVLGAYLFFKSGLHPEPESVKNDTLEYAKEQDVFSQWFETQCYATGSDNLKLNNEVVYISYARWCRMEGETALAKSEFGKKMKKKGIKSIQSNSKRFYLGLMLGDEPESNLDNEGRSNSAGPRHLGDLE